MMKKYFFILGLTLCNTFICKAQVQTRVNFPYQNDLKGDNNNPPVDVVGVPNRNQVFTQNGIQLTNSSGGQSGAVVLNNASFTSNQGLTIEFEYVMYGGTETLGRNGDGLSIFLYDSEADINNLTGVAGGGLSYTYSRYNPGNFADPGVPGLNKAYVGIGFDQFGNFKEPGNAIGIAGYYGLGSQLTIRGAMRHTPIGADALDANGDATSYISKYPLIYNNERFQGYPVLFSRSTNYSSSNSSEARGRYLDLNNNSDSNVQYIPITTNLSTDIEIRGGGTGPNPGITTENYRKATITLGPADPNIGGGYYITVDLQDGVNTVRIVENFHYKENFYYREDNNFSSNSQPLESSKIYSLNASVPTEFKIGFGASTGGATQFHIIKNLVVDLAYTPRFEPDYAKLCENADEVIIDVYSNDYVYNGPIYGPPIQGNGPTNIDYESFKFTDSDIIPFNELGSWNGNILSYNSPNEGIWEYNKTTGLVTFIPNSNYSGHAIIYYTAKGTASQGGPFNQDEYYSVPDEIVVERITCGGSIINPQLPSRGKKPSSN